MRTEQPSSHDKTVGRDGIRATVTGNSNATGNSNSSSSNVNVNVNINATTFPASFTCKNSMAVVNLRVLFAGFVVLLLLNTFRMSYKLQAIITPNAEAPWEYEPNMLREKTPPAPAAAASVKWDKSIKEWGCSRKETPLIFIHIGKAGGGGVRARIAASALDYARNHSWATERHLDDAYYPMEKQIITNTNTGETKTETVHGGFCNYIFTNPYPESKSHPCNARTPLGQAIACPFPEAIYDAPRCCKNANFNNTSCEHTAYVGHNFLGTELHWLPTSYFVDWWNNLPHTNTDPHGKQQVLRLLESRGSRSNMPCLNNKGTTKLKYKAHYLKCTQQREVLADQASRLAYQDVLGDSKDWSHLYSSMPILRVTVARDPFTWLLSRFYWHTHQRHFACDDMDAATGGPGAGALHRSAHEFLEQGNNEGSAGWAQRLALFYILQLCGYDCIARLHNGEISSLDELERQADGNLRRSFAVVGLLNETNTFYDMMSARVDYLNTSLNPEVTGGGHSSKRSYGGTYDYCKNLWYKNTTWHRQLLEASPEIAMLNRLWNTAQEVNRFQLAELKSCM
jgi:hypothetical protein